MQYKTLLDMLKIRTVFQIFCVIYASICTCRYTTLLHSGNSMVQSAGPQVNSTGTTKGELDGYPDNHHHRAQLFHRRNDFGISVDTPSQIAILVGKNEQTPL